MIRDYQFWKSWKNKTKREMEAINSVQIGRKLILDTVPKSEIYAIYLKGSFIHRELKKHSDVDFTVILSSPRYFSKIKKLNESNKNKYKPQIGVSAYTLRELKTGKQTQFFSKHSKTRMGPKRVVEQLWHYKLIYGRDVGELGLEEADSKKLLTGLLNFYKTVFIPRYEHKEVGFSDLVKQVFWLTYYEQKFLGKKPTSGFGAISKSVSDKSHIVHEALKYRKKNTKNEVERADFVKRFKMYVKQLGGLTP